MDELREEFNNYYENWYNETLVLSTGITENKWFRKIVEMGINAVPYIKEIVLKEDTWLATALSEILPNVVTVNGYVGISQYCDFWRKVFLLIDEKELIEYNGNQKKTEN